MEPQGSLPHSQVPATCPYPEPARSRETSLICKVKQNCIAKVAKPCCNFLYQKKNYDTQYL